MLASLGALLLVSAVGVTKSNPNGYYYLESGGYVAGEVLADDGASVKIRHRDTKEVHSFVYKDFTDRTQYKLRSYALGTKDGEDQVELANFALGLGLHSEAGLHFRLSARLNPGMWDVAEDGLRRVEQARADQKLDLAASYLESGRFSDAQEMLKDLMGDEDGSVVERAQALMDTFPNITRSKPYFVEESIPAFARIRKYYERAKESNREGLLNTRSSSRANRKFRSATKDIRRALDLLNRLRDKEKGREGIFERAALDMERALLELHATTALNRSSLNVVQQSYRKALTVLNEALAFDQTNKLLLEARTRVEEAVSNASSVLVSSL